MISVPAPSRAHIAGNLVLRKFCHGCLEFRLPARLLSFLRFGRIYSTQISQGVLYFTILITWRSLKLRHSDTRTEKSHRFQGWPCKCVNRSVKPAQELSWLGWAGWPDGSPAAEPPPCIVGGGLELQSIPSQPLQQKLFGKNVKEHVARLH